MSRIRVWCCLGQKVQGPTDERSSSWQAIDLALCDRVVAIHKGRVLFDLPLADLMDRAGATGLENYFMSQIRESS